jgi:hypothetical protein
MQQQQQYQEYPLISLQISLEIKKVYMLVKYII